MKKKNIKQLIINNSWQLFHEKGYKNTTIEDILTACNIAKGSFYYYFKKKSDLLETLADILDKKYEEITPTVNPSFNSLKKLLYLSICVQGYIEENIDRNLLATLYATQLTSSKSSSLTDKNRIYFKIIYNIIKEGQEQGEIINSINASYIAEYYSVCEWGIIARWCLDKGSFSLVNQTKIYIPVMLKAFSNME